MKDEYYYLIYTEKEHPSRSELDLPPRVRLVYLSENRRVYQIFETNTEGARSYFLEKEAKLLLEK